MSNASVPNEVLNQDVCSIARRLTAFANELHKSASAMGHEFLPADIKRLEKYLDSWEATVEWVVGQERLDLPHSHPLKHAVAPMPALPPVENAAVDDVVRYMVTARDELLMSASSNQATGLDAADAERHRKVLEKVADFLENYIKQILPLDLPESTRSASASV